MLTCTDVKKTFDKGLATEKVALGGVNLHLRESDFITVIGGNGAGKSTFLNAVAGVFNVDSGTITIDGHDVNRHPEYTRARLIRRAFRPLIAPPLSSEHMRAKLIGRVFQDPRMGTAPSMSIEENLAIAYRRCKRRTLRWGIKRSERAIYRESLAVLGLGLEDRLSVKVGTLSGGQRQALTLLMATIQKPKLLLLDEHTAALDPKTAKIVLDLTDKLVHDNQLTTLMVTHNMRDALKSGNRLMMMHEGRIILDVQNADEKAKLTVPDLLKMFEQASGEEMLSDRMLLT